MNSTCIPFIKNARTIDYEDPTNEKHKTTEIEYNDLRTVCALIKNLSNDDLIYRYIALVVKYIKNNKTNPISVDQKNDIKQKIKNIIDSQLPTPHGIQHEGYKIVAEAALLSLDPYDKVKWEDLSEKARQIGNKSDKGLVLAMIADKITVKTNKKKIELMDEAVNIIKSIPSIYDKTNRWEATWDIWLDIDKGQFTKNLKVAYTDLLAAKDGEMNGLRDLIDMAHQHEPELAKSFVTMLDDDEARRKLKKPFLKLIENKTKIKDACNSKSFDAKLNAIQFQAVFRKMLEELNAGSRVSKDVTDTFELIEKASTLSLIDAFDAYMFFIQNAIKKYEINKKNPDIITAIFFATLENTKLIGILSADNIIKMKNLFSIGNKKSNLKNPIITPGENAIAMTRIKEWLENNIEAKIYLIDPYFTEDDLYLIKFIKETNPECSVTILTSKENNNNNHEDPIDKNRSTNKDVYIRAWEKISSEPPVETNVIIIWDKISKKCPFHDRWYVAGDKNTLKTYLSLGTSFNGLGNRDSQIIELSDSESLIPVQELVKKYILDRDKKVGHFTLKYELFELEY